MKLIFLFFIYCFILISSSVVASGQWNVYVEFQSAADYQSAGKPKNPPPDRKGDRWEEFFVEPYKIINGRYTLRKGGKGCECTVYLENQPYADANRSAIGGLCDRSEVMKDTQIYKVVMRGECPS